MIELHPTVPGCPPTRLILRPPRALNGRQMGLLFAAQTGAMWVVALLSAVQGNVFAPPFALLDSLIVAAALRWLWRLGERREQIDIDARAVRVSKQASRTPTQGPVFEAHPSGVRLQVRGAGYEPRVLLDSQGWRVEVGGFLAPHEREVLAEQLREALRAATGRGAAQVVS